MADIFGMVRFELNVGANSGLNKVEVADHVALGTPASMR
jgi:hypothetical protein